MLSLFHRGEGFNAIRYFHWLSDAPCWMRIAHVGHKTVSGGDINMCIILLS